jgi:methylated-DNA-protein-cysteine methyltransferase-like protein
MSNLPLSKNYLKIWETVQRIPYGKVATYGQIASLAGFAGHARLVGYALHATPDDMQIPWHRVINYQGRIIMISKRRYWKGKELFSFGKKLI